MKNILRSGVTLLCLAATPTFGNASSLTAYDDEAIAPFLWGWMDEVTMSDEGLKKIVAKTDPLRPFFLAYRLLVQHQRTSDPAMLESAVRALNYMVDEYQPAERNADGYRWFYGFDYDGGIKAPWWSGMDGFFGPMALYAGWQATGDERFKDISIASAKRMLKDPTQGGVLWRNGDSCWISEYSWNGMKEDQEYYVLNGHLWGLQALYMLAEASQDKELNEAYRCARKGTVERLSQFYNAGDTWTWYQLTPKVINPTHYNIVEQAQFLAMAKITGDDVYTEPAQHRGEIFKKSYPLSLVKTDAGQEIQFSMMGTPNPYWTDTYPVTVRCKVGDEVVEKQNASVYDEAIPLSERLVLRLPVASTPSSCAVSIHSNVEVKLYEQTDFVVETRSRDLIDLAAHADLRSTEKDDTGSFRLEVSADQYWWIKLFERVSKKPKNESRVKIDVDREIGPTDTLAMTINPETKVQLGVIFVDDAGKSAFRYYPDLEAGKDNIVVLSTIGFQRGDELGEHIKSAMLRFYTHDIDRSFDASIKGVEVLRSPLHVQQYMKEHSGGHFPQQ